MLRLAPLVAREPHGLSARATFRLDALDVHLARHLVDNVVRPDAEAELEMPHTLDAVLRISLFSESGDQEVLRSKLTFSPDVGIGLVCLFSTNPALLVTIRHP